VADPHRGGVRIVMGILNFGSFIIDHVYRVPHFVRPGETLPATEYRTFAGGKGFNQTVALARAGIRSAHAGSIGADGRWLLERLQTAGVDVADVVIGDEPTGHGIIQVTPQGENAILQHPGANRTITRGHVQRTLARFGAGDWLLLQNEVNELERLVTIGHRRGMRIVLNPAPMDAAIARLPLELVDLLIVNEVEAADLTGASTPDAMLASLHARLPRSALVLTLGVRGALYQDAERRIETPSVPATAVDTTGAGDTFTGYLVASLVAGRAIDVALGRAARAAALCVGRPGAADSIPYAHEVDVPG
jgi:ribokinase